MKYVESLQWGWLQNKLSSCSSLRMMTLYRREHCRRRSHRDPAGFHLHKHIRNRTLHQHSHHHHHHHHPRMMFEHYSSLSTMIMFCRWSLGRYSSHGKQRHRKKNHNCIRWSVFHRDRTTVNPLTPARHWLCEFREWLKNANFHGRKHFPAYSGDWYRPPTIHHSQ